MPPTTESLTLPALRAAYGGGLTPTALCAELLPAIAANRGVFIARPSDEEVLERCRCGVGRWEAPPSRQRCRALTRMHVLAAGAAGTRARAGGTLPDPGCVLHMPNVPWLTLAPLTGSWRACRRSSRGPCGACRLP